MSNSEEFTNIINENPLFNSTSKKTSNKMHALKNSSNKKRTKSKNVNENSDTKTNPNKIKAPLSTSSRIKKCLIVIKLI